MRLDSKIFAKRSSVKHNNKYDYSKVDYVNSNTKVCIICPEHGEFWQTPCNHLYGGYGCPECKKERLSQLKRKDKEDFIKQSKQIHGNKYDYSKVDYKTCETKVCIVCPEHGDFMIRPNDHLKGVGCAKCAGIYSPSTEEFIKQIKQIHGDKYDYSKVEYVNNKTKICIICPEHGEFWQTPKNHKNGQGCPICGYRKRAQRNTYTIEQFVEKANIVHNNKYDYSKSEISEDGYITITCPKHGDFKQNRHDHLLGYGCPICGKTMSVAENELFDIINKNIDCEVEKRNRTILKPLELDIFSPKYKIAIEYDGLMWHCEKYQTDKNYHLKKTEKAKEKDIRLIHIFEDEWTYKKNIVISMLNNLFGKTTQRIYARNCDIRQVSTKEKKVFIEQNHIQGDCPSSCAYGLYYKNELVSIMTFGRPRQQKKYNDNYDNTWELIRFCNRLNTNIVGGASKILKHFISEKKPKIIVSYADKRWSNGNLYFKLGFKHIRDSKPNYHYVVGNKRENRFKYRKGQLVKQGYNSNKSEHEIMLERKIYRIYDCGTMVFEMKI